MRPRRVPASNKVFELPGGNEDNSLWVEVLMAEDSTLGACPAIRSVFVPSQEEREQIAAGGNVSLTILGTAQPPVVMEVTDEQPGRAPVQSSWPEHLRDDAPSQTCSTCGRTTWDQAEFGQRCRMPQPTGFACPGTFQ